VTTPAPNSNPSSLMSIGAAAERLGISRRTLYSRIAMGDVRTVRLGGRIVRIDPVDLAHYVEARKTSSGATK
jgi:excisionase family DNA binding protein